MEEWKIAIYVGVGIVVLAGVLFAAKSEGPSIRRYLRMRRM